MSKEIRVNDIIAQKDHPRTLRLVKRIEPKRIILEKPTGATCSISIFDQGDWIRVGHANPSKSRWTNELSDIRLRMKAHDLSANEITTLDLNDRIRCAVKGLRKGAQEPTTDDELLWELSRCMGFSAGQPNLRQLMSMILDELDQKWYDMPMEGIDE